jgi:dihydroxyacetone kinase-like protein
MNLKPVIQALCSRILSEQEKLTAWDQAVGDGDFGINLERGATSVLSALSKICDSVTADELLMEIGKTLNSAGCGSGGTLISLGIIAGSRRCENISSFLEAVLSKIQAAGKACVGDKTMVDALFPAVEALKRGGTLEEAAIAAREGAERTREMVGKRGRSLYSQARATGVQDPGAYLVAILLGEAAHWQKEQSK